MIFELVKWIGTKILLRKIRNISDLEEMFSYVQSQFDISDDKGRQAFKTFYYALPPIPIPKDPFSQEYRNFQLVLYNHLSGKNDYSIENESVEFDLRVAEQTPFPYSTQSPTTIGDQLLAIGFIIKKMKLPHGSKIVEFGPGWGNLTVQLIQSGYQVSCVETEKRFIELLKTRTENRSSQITFINKDMLTFVETCTEKFDAAIFYESFHHCIDPILLIQKLSAILTEKGIICFAAEPVISGPSAFLPYPWGMRLDGMSVWSIRKWGWMELGFQERFFKDILKKSGFFVKKIKSSVSPLTTLYIASKKKVTSREKILEIIAFLYDYIPFQKKSNP